MKRVAWFFFLIFFAFAGNVLALNSPEGLYQKGNASYENEDYEKAASCYEELIAADQINPEVFYNLGNSYFKLKKIGKAILNYERALRLDPRDNDIQMNLRLARSMAVDKINSPDKGFILDALYFLYTRVNINELTIMCSFFYLAVILILVFSIFFIAKRRTFVYTAGLLGIIFLILLISLAVKIRNDSLIKTGIIVAEKADVRSGPKQDYLLQFSLHEGTKVNIEKEAQGWYEISLSRDLKGWVPKNSVGII